jgi:hypothetical protein
VQKLKHVAASLQRNTEKFYYLHNVRWVTSSKYDAPSALVKGWKCITVHLESIATEKDSASAIAISLLLKFTNFKFVHMLNFLLDYLVIVHNLSHLFQREQLFV